VGTGWRVTTIGDGFAERLALRPAAERSIVVYEVARPTLVLGSSQRDDTVAWDRAAARGVEVVRRRSGGSAVLVGPGTAVWVDVTIPTGDPLWDHDVGRAFHWLGAAWTDVLAAAGLGAVWHDGPMRRTAWSDRVCFAGLGPGEVTVEGRKVVGLRRVRTGPGRGGVGAGRRGRRLRHRRRRRHRGRPVRQVGYGHGVSRLAGRGHRVL
jgi:lipoate-protein ligase A